MATTRPASTEVRHDRGAIQKTAPSIRKFAASRVAVERVTAIAHPWLTRHSITLLRVSVGVIALGFGLLKYFPGVSPAENLVETTTHLLTFGLVPDKVAMMGVATLECAIGLSLIIGRGLRVTIYLLVLWILGILSPVVLLSERLFSGPNHAPTLEGQYVLKDVILFTASLVIATTLYHSKHSAEHQSTHDENR
jgi:putative oxidoreductase